MDVVLLLVSFAIILAGALLFTNAVEWIGHRLGLGRGGGRQPARRGRHGDAGDADRDRRHASDAERGLRRGRDRGDRRRPLPARAPWRWAWSASSPTSTASAASQGVRAERPRADPGARPALLPRLLRASPGRWPGGRRRRCGSRSGSSSCSPTRSTSAAPCAAAGEVQGEETLEPLDLRAPRRARAGTSPRAAALRHAAPGRPRRDGRRRPPLRRRAAQHRRAASASSRSSWP